MQKLLKLLVATVVILIIGGCGGSSGGDPGPETYSASLTSIQLQKKGSGEALGIANIPVDSATITRQ